MAVYGGGPQRKEIPQTACGAKALTTFWIWLEPADPCD
jgi:hypothetical protein